MATSKIHAQRSKKLHQLSKKTTRVHRNRKAPRLYMKGTMAGYARGLHGSTKQVALLRVDNVNTREDAKWYTGKRVCYVYHGYKVKRCVRWSKAPARRSTTRALWGRVSRPHGNSGMLRARFNGSALPAAAIGRRVRVYLYPSNI